MKKSEKDKLRSFVRMELALGHDIKETVRVAKMFGFKTATIRNYYKALSGK